MSYKHLSKDTVEAINTIKDDMDLTVFQTEVIKLAEQIANEAGRYNIIPQDVNTAILRLKASLNEQCARVQK